MLTVHISRVDYLSRIERKIYEAMIMLVNGLRLVAQTTSPRWHDCELEFQTPIHN